MFGAAAEHYDATGPGYAEELVAEKLAAADLADRAAVEVGRAPGKATVLFAAHGIPLMCVESDTHMAGAMRRSTAQYAQV